MCTPHNIVIALDAETSWLRYDGQFTPPSLQGSIVFPGNSGVMDWGGLTG